MEGFSANVCLGEETPPSNVERNSIERKEYPTSGQTAKNAIPGKNNSITVSGEVFAASPCNGLNGGVSDK